MGTTASPASEEELAMRAAALAGFTLGEVAKRLEITLPADLRRSKGAVGELLERALGATAASKPVPDFEHLGIELKTVPIDAKNRPRESTHVCTVALNDLIGQRWESSTVRLKLTRVLWIPVDGTPNRALAERCIGAARLWSPSSRDEDLLRRDWEEHMELITTGRLNELDARLGSVLQVRPKAANRDALSAASDADGAPSATLPRGFYLRAQFTDRILNVGEYS